MGNKRSAANVRSGKVRDLRDTTFRGRVRRAAAGLRNRVLGTPFPRRNG